MPTWILCLWPGLPRLWLQGDLRALFTATLFAVLLQFALVTKFVWPDWISTFVAVGLWLATLGTWGFFAVKSWRQLPFLVGHRHHETADALFLQAQTEYLRGRWTQTEDLLEKALRNNHGDVEARLMLASLFRHTKRIEQSKEQLKMLERFHASWKWQPEISREQALLQRVELEANAADGNGLTETVSKAA